MPAKLSNKEVRRYLRLVEKWKLKGKTIERDYRFRNFVQAMKFVNNVARFAVKLVVHPYILFYRWNHVKISIYTHSIGGLSESDFVLATKINKLKH